MAAETSGLPVGKQWRELFPPSLSSFPLYSPKVAKGADQIQETFLATPKELLIYLLAAISLFSPREMLTLCREAYTGVQHPSIMLSVPVKLNLI